MISKCFILLLFINDNINHIKVTTTKSTSSTVTTASICVDRATSVCVVYIAKLGENICNSLGSISGILFGEYCKKSCKKC
jgi:hypothetical protein